MSGFVCAAHDWGSWQGNTNGFKFQSNTPRSRPVISVISLALQLVQHGMAAFPPWEFRDALERLRYDHPGCSFEGRPQGLIPLLKIGHPAVEFS